ncbi:hypothetical protein AURDEDRAFT_165916 [Auricularia subglabra TFB-10046 SS5]|nr:hypothetical protein AURDEDRAFT_165916 [Auricularia subglabra TFB-10046 SS5]
MPETFHSTLIALGDLAIGAQVAPLISPGLKSQIIAQIRHSWPKADLMNLSRYILVRHNFGLEHLTYYRPTWERFDKEPLDRVFRSEVCLFAITTLCSGIPASSDVDRYCPESPNQPRAMRYILSRWPGSDAYGVVDLARRYWHYLKDDASVDLETELRRRLQPFQEEDYRIKLASRYGGRSGLVELLVFLLEEAPGDCVKAACDLIFKVLELEHGTRTHMCLVYMLGSDDAGIADAAWDDRLWEAGTYYMARALPLVQDCVYGWKTGITAPDHDNRPDFEICLARTIIRLFIPSHIRALGVIICSLGNPTTYDTGARLVRLFSYSATKDWDDSDMAWDLGSYLRTAVARLSEQDPGTDVSMRRLIAAIRALRPFCMRRDDLRAAWDRIGLPVDPEYSDPFWCDEDFTLGWFFSEDDPSSAAEEALPPEEAETHAHVVPPDCLALHYLDAAMR